MLQNYFPLWIEDKPNVEEAIFQVGVAGFSLGHDERVVLARNLPQFFRFLARNVNGALARELRVVQIKHLVVEGLQGAFRKSNQPHRNIKGRKPTGSLHQVVQMIEIDFDVLAAADSPNRRNEPDCCVGFDHGGLPRSRAFNHKGLRFSSKHNRVLRGFPQLAAFQ